MPSPHTECSICANDSAEESLGFRASATIYKKIPQPPTVCNRIKRYHDLLAEGPETQKQLCVQALLKITECLQNNPLTKGWENIEKKQTTKPHCVEENNTVNFIISLRCELWASC